MEDREIFSAITTIPPVYIRLDGRAFHKLSRDLGLQKPYDERFCRAMVGTCRMLAAKSGLSPVFAYTFSDEISLYFTELPFSGRVEKMDSVAASFAASALTLALRAGIPLAFDARVIQTTPAHAVEYLVSRQDEAWRNHVNAYCQQALVTGGLTARQAAARLKGRPAKEMHEMMHRRGVNLAKTPAWQRRGVMVYRSETEREGYNPKTKKAVVARRNVVVADADLPLFSTDKGLTFLRRIIEGG